MTLFTGVPVAGRVVMNGEGRQLDAGLIRTCSIGISMSSEKNIS